MANMHFWRSKQQGKLSWVQGLLCSITIALGWGVGMTSTLAAQKVTICLGPFQQAIAIADIEAFAKTGKLPENLQIFRTLLTPQLQELLNQRLQVDPALADKF